MHSGKREMNGFSSYKPLTPYHAGCVVKSPLRYDWYNSIFSNYGKFPKSTTFSAPFLRSSLRLDTKILFPRISFRVNKTDIENQYDLYSITCAYGSSMLEGVYFTISYAPVAGIIFLCIIIAVASTEGLIIFVLDISNVFQNTILPYPEETFYLSLPHLYLEWFKINCPKHSLAS